MKSSKKTIGLIVGGILIMIAAVVIGVGVKLTPTVNQAMHIAELLEPFLKAENKTIHMSISATTENHSMDVETDIYMISEEEVNYLVLEQSDLRVFVVENLLLLENGKAFKIGEEVQKQTSSYKNLLPHIMELYELLQITTEETAEGAVYEVTVTGEQMSQLLEIVSLESIEKLQLQLIEKSEKLDKIQLKGSGELSGAAMELQVDISGFRELQPQEYQIPEIVKQSVAEVNPDELLSLSEDLYRLLLAAAPLLEQESLDGTLALDVNCWFIQYETAIKLSDLQMNSNSNIDSQQLQELPQIIGWLFMEGDIQCEEQGTEYLYSLELDEQAMSQLVDMIVPELEQYGAELTAGTSVITLKENKISSMEISIEGKINVLIAKAPITVNARFVFE